MTRRVESRKSNLRVVWRGSQRVNYKCMYVVYNCMYVMYVNSGGIVGGGGTSKYNVSLIFYLPFIYQQQHSTRYFFLVLNSAT